MCVPVVWGGQVMESSNRFAVLCPETVTGIKTTDDLRQLVIKHGKKNVCVSWESVTVADCVVTKRIYSVVGTRQTAKGVLVTVKISRKKFRSLYLEKIIEVTVD